MSQRGEEDSNTLGMGGLSLSEFKASQKELVKKNQLKEWAELAAGLQVESRCRVDTNVATVRFLECDIEGLPGILRPRYTSFPHQRESFSSANPSGSHLIGSATGQVGGGWESSTIAQWERTTEP